VDKVEKQRATEKPFAKRSGSFLKFASGKKWSVGVFPWDLNGGAYQIFDKKGVKICSSWKRDGLYSPN
jgi:hypothetical protein